MVRPSIIVCGDIMLDHNVYTTIEKIANEAPIPVFNKTTEEYQLGGCGNVLKNLASLGCERMYIFSVIGNDKNGSEISRLLESLDVRVNIITLDGMRTVTKQRFFCDNRIVHRCDTENNSDIQERMKSSVSFTSKIKHILETEHIDCIIMSDYNKGVLHYQHCQDIIEIANSHNVFTCVDPKHNYLKYTGCTLIKPNRREAYDIFNVSNSVSLETLHTIIYNKIKCKYSVITLAEKGITLYDGTTLIHEVPTTHAIIDVTGAGDIVCCILGYFLPKRKEDARSIIHLATQIATKSVEYPGTYTIRPSDIELCNGKRISAEQLDYVRNKHEQVVFTNGCFDILHSGHIHLFKFCKERGTVVVGLNSDESIRNLKGDTRPVNALKTRISILEAIRYIDYIVAFEEETPHSVIKRLRPDFLVKGGDYDVGKIIGSEFSKHTLTCAYLDGNSSTSIIERIKRCEG